MKQSSREVSAETVICCQGETAGSRPLVGRQRVFSCRVDAGCRQNRSNLTPPTYSYGTKSRDFTSVPRSPQPGSRNETYPHWGACRDLDGKMHGVCRMSGTCKEFGVNRWGQQRQLWQRQRQSPEFWPTYSVTPRGGTKLQADNACQLVGAG